MTAFPRSNRCRAGRAAGAVWSLALVMAVFFSCAQNATRPRPLVVTGVVVAVDGRGLGNVQAFVVKDGDRRYRVHVARGADYGFPLGHLNAHRATGEPVTVELEQRDGRLYALSIADAAETP